ncbi:uncharacterized protein LOC122939459 [Bufo gargarizans]|uniref:uncharacterized protein LOC122939459 n=1 Tax=Bufo gargarizans TaxID=30331 RepID=UPI001CF40DFC|nr:uncharacterized protein LOC122939459 [Bufo gargarizans]
MKIGENLRPKKRKNEQKMKCTRPAEPNEKAPGVEKEKRSNDAEKTMEETTEETTEDVDEIPPILQNILTMANAKRASPPVPEISALQSPPAQDQKPARSTRPQKSKLSRIPRPPPVQAKEPAISMQLPPSPPRLPPPADVVDRPPAASSASSQKDELRVRSPEGPQIPPFILQFQDQSWFSLVLPEAEAQYSEFQPRLLHAFLQAGQPMRSQLLCALQTLYQQGHLKNLELVFRTLRDAINGADLMVIEGQEFVWHCLRFMNDLSQARKELIVELLVMCVQLQDPHRGRFIALFHEFGVYDPHGFIAKKCRSWDNWDETRNSREALRKICEDWLQQWTDRLMDRLHAGTTWNKEPRASHGGKSIKCQTVRSLGGNRTRQEDLSYDVTAIDVLNYYCDVQMKRELDVLRDCELKHGSTVLALPPIDRRRALLRLGETGMHRRQRDQAGGRFPAVRPLCPDMIPFINLPVKKVTLSPFISIEEAPTRTRFTGSLRQDIQRYFMVQQSYIERY